VDQLRLGMSLTVAESALAVPSHFSTWNESMDKARPSPPQNISWNILSLTLVCL
jgi:hypothetical protein